MSGSASGVPNSGQEEQASNLDVEIQLSSLAPSKLMTLPLTVGSTSISALVDTGATVCLIQSSLVGPVPLTPSSCPILGLGGSKIVPLGNTLVSFRAGSLLFECECAVVSDSVLCYPVILGNNFFQQYGVVVDLPSQKLSGKISGGFWEIYLVPDAPIKTVVRAVPIYCASDTTIDIDSGCVPFSVTGISTECISDSQDYYYDGFLDNKFKYLSGQCGILSISKGIEQLVLIHRLPGGKHPHAMIKRGSLLGTLSTVVDVEPDPTVSVNLVHSESDVWTPDKIQSQINLTEVDPEQSARVISMIMHQSSALSCGDHDIGCAGVTKHRIELHDNTPIRQKPRRFPEPVINEIERQCDELRELDIIEYSKSPWSSPIVPIKKKDGSIRLCIDYRKLNDKTKADRFPMPNMTDMVYSLHGTQFFTTLDLVKGYYQVPLDPDSAECTAFSTTKNHYQFKRLSFGLKNAPGAFQREMQEVLREFNTKQVIVYIDDILIMSRNFDEHLNLVSKVLATLARYDMKIKLSKCSWFQREVTFLGHIVGRFGIRKSTEYMETVSSFPLPQTVKQLRSFLGLINFQRKFIPHCSTLTKPLTFLMGCPDKTPITWTAEMTESFDLLKQGLSQYLELAYPDYSPQAAKLELSTDASQYGAGACLTQLQNGDIRVISYASTTFNKAQTHYSTIERELAAIRWAVSVFRSFLYGVPFILFTDHKPLVYMNNMSRQNSRIMRTMNELSEYDFEVCYRAGKDNTIADILSRLGDVPLRGDVDLGNPAELPHGLRLLDKVDGGGDSMIVSLRAVLQHHREMHDPTMAVPDSDLNMRQVLVDEITTYPHMYGVVLNRSLKNELRLAKLPGQLPLLIFLTAFSKIFDLQVWVHHGMTHPVVHRLEGTGVATDLSKRVHLQCLTMVHYNPVRESKLYQAPPIISQPELPQVLVADCDTDEDGGVLDGILARYQLLRLSCSLEHTPTRTSTCITVGGENFCALIDTGAQISLVSELVWDGFSEVVKELANFQSEIVQIRCIGSEGAATKGTVELRFKLMDSGPEHSAPFAIVKNGAMPFCFLLGANLVQQLCLKLDFASGQLSAGEATTQLIFPLADSTSVDSTHIQLCLSQSLVVPEAEPELTPDELSFLQRCPLLSLSQVRLVQQRQHVTKMLYTRIEKNIEPNLWKARSLQVFKRYASKLSISSGILWFNSLDGPRMVIPFLFLVELALQIHWQMSHVGRNKLIHLLRTCVWHPSIHEVAGDITLSCPHCQLYKTSVSGPSPPMIKIESAYPFDLIAADLILLPKTSRGHIGCLVVVDHFSKWLSIVPIRNKTASTVASVFAERVLPTLPVKPNRILTDNGVEFRSDLFNSILSTVGIKHIYSTPYKPSSNGAVERCNRTVSQLLRCMAEKPGSWDTNLPVAVMDYNHTWHSQINMSPSQCLMRISHSGGDGPILDSGTTAQWKVGHPSFAPFHLGDSVAMKVPMHGNLTSNKLNPRFSGPYRVVQVNPNSVTYVILDDIAQVGRKYRVHHAQLKLWHSPPLYLLSHPCYKPLVRRTDSFPTAGDTSGDSSDCDFVEPVNEERYLTQDESDNSTSDSGTVDRSVSTDSPSSGSLPDPAVKSVVSSGALFDSSTAESDFLGFSPKLDVRSKSLIPVNRGTSPSKTQFQSVGTQTVLPLVPHSSSPVLGFPLLGSFISGVSPIPTSLTPHLVAANASHVFQHELIHQDLSFLGDVVDILNAQEESLVSFQMIVDELSQQIWSPPILETVSTPNTAAPSEAGLTSSATEDDGQRAPSLSLSSLGLLPVGWSSPNHAAPDQVSHGQLFLSHSNTDLLTVDHSEEPADQTVPGKNACVGEHKSVTFQDSVFLPSQLEHSAGPAVPPAEDPKPIIPRVVMLSPIVLTQNETNLPSQEFDGFCAAPGQPDYLRRLVIARARLSLSPIRTHLEEARSLIEEYRRRSRSRLLSTYRDNLSELPTSESVHDSHDTIVQPVARETRSRGPVADLPYVQPRTLEYRSSKK